MHGAKMSVKRYSFADFVRDEMDNDEKNNHLSWLMWSAVPILNILIWMAMRITYYQKTMRVIRK